LQEERKRRREAASAEGAGAGTEAKPKKTKKGKGTRERPGEEQKGAVSAEDRARNDRTREKARALAEKWLRRKDQEPRLKAALESSSEEPSDGGEEEEDMEEDDEAQGADDQALAEALAESQREFERGPSQPIAQLRNPRETVEDPEVPSGADSSRGPPAGTPGPEPLVPVVPVPLIDEEESDDDIEEIPIPKVAPTIPRWRAAGLTRPPPTRAKARR
jgi:hypothetical protein